MTDNRDLNSAEEQEKKDLAFLKPNDPFHRKPSTSEVRKPIPMPKTIIRPASSAMVDTRNQSKPEVTPQASYSGSLSSQKASSNNASLYGTSYKPSSGSSTIPASSLSSQGSTSSAFSSGSSLNTSQSSLYKNAHSSGIVSSPSTMISNTNSMSKSTLTSSPYSSSVTSSYTTTNSKTSTAFSNASMSSPSSGSSTFSSQANASYSSGSSFSSSSSFAKSTSKVDGLKSSYLVDTKTTTTSLNPSTSITKPGVSQFNTSSLQSTAAPFSTQSLSNPSSLQRTTNSYGTTAKNTSVLGNTQSTSTLFSSQKAGAQNLSAPSAFSLHSQEVQGAGQRHVSSSAGIFGSAPAARNTLPTSLSSNVKGEIKISDDEFVLLRDFLYDKCGIYIADNRKYLIENRLSTRLKELGLRTFGEYHKFLKFDDHKKTELNKFFESMTTNETSFFRNMPQLEIVRDIVFKKIIEENRGKKKLRIWSAGCSSGEEPYTLAIILAELLGAEMSSWDIKITANDLSTAVLALAEDGIYSEYALRTTPAQYVQKYFNKEGNLYRIDPQLKKHIQFGQINLNDKNQTHNVERSHVVFCRNVIIYFDDEVKRNVITAFYDNLLDNGTLIIGHSESLHNISRAFKPDHYSGTLLYTKLG